ncbi:MAG: transcriptional regulator [Acidimicrobiia bacterium]|nr:transcriptional regulator [Acidimicrobiia bacterium]MDH4307917.1 transcriptional regulator [Acidimicrobiia bacterium]MDH5292965.1 transcriptional regulator [Acidimicrobiia bacterium]
MTDHPSARLDDTIHQRVRLGILAVLAEADAADFGYLKQRLDLTDGNLSRHLQVLEDAGHVEIEKGFEGKRPKTWIHATRQGRKAFSEHLVALQQLIDMATQRRE